VQTGGVMVGPSTGGLVSGARRSAEQHRLQHEVLSSMELRQRFPVFEPEEEMNGVWEPRAGVLFPELAIQAHLGLASKLGADLHFNETVLKWEADGEGVRVQTESATYAAANLVISAGPWASSLMPCLALPLTVERQVLYWFHPSARSALFRPPSCPIYIWEYGAGQFFYGFPDLGDGIKVAMHHQGSVADPSNVEREVRAEEVEGILKVLKRFMPAAVGKLRATAVCLYTNTPDEHFILDRHPLYPQVVVVSPCSGHGFKFSSVVGEVAAALVRDKEPELNLNLFRIGRFMRT
jgi:sarcosine oxidase